MAISTCEYLRIDPKEGVERVVSHWALRKLHAARPAASVEDERLLAKQICEKFSKFPGISYADMAEKAVECGRKELATLLPENEPQLVRQVMMLMKLNRNEKALQRATESGDPDLSKLILLLYILGSCRNYCFQFTPLFFICERLWKRKAIWN